MTFPPQMDTVQRHVDDAVAKGARVLAGGHRRPGKGDFYEPTVLVDVDHTMECMTEETFGPTLPIMKVADQEEADQLANDSVYGPGRLGVHQGRHARRADRRSGSRPARSCVNDAMINYTALELADGRRQGVGMGSRHGAEGIRKFCQQQAILVSRIHPKRDVHMYPYKPFVTKGIGRLLKVLYGPRQARLARSSDPAHDRVRAHCGGLLGRPPTSPAGCSAGGCRRSSSCSSSSCRGSSCC
jgi:hypothetical protein